MKNVWNWFKKRPATKAAWFGVFTGTLALVVVIIQTVILSRQTRLLDRQTIISEAQTELLSKQIEASSRPFVEIKFNVNKETDTLSIENKGQFEIYNIKVYQVYFAKLPNHGWYISASSAPLFSQSESKKKYITELSHTYENRFKTPPVPPEFVSNIEMEYLNTIILFQRLIDGKNYLSIIPGRLVRLENEIQRWTLAAEESAVAGPLAKLCDVGLEISFEYLKRRPFLKDYELYNSSYTIGSTPTGCLGTIEWKN